MQIPLHGTSQMQTKCVDLFLQPELCAFLNPAATGCQMTDRPENELQKHQSLVNGHVWSK